VRRRVRALSSFGQPWTRHLLVVVGMAAVAVAALSYYGLSASDGTKAPGYRSRPDVTTSASPSSLGPALPVAAGIDPCTLLTAAVIDASTGGRYEAGRPLTRADGAYCTFRRLDAAGEVTLSLYTQTRLDAAVRQDPNVAQTDLRSVLERTKELAELGPSDYIRATGIGDVGYEIGSSDPARTDRLAVIAGGDLVVLAATDPTVPTPVVRAWMVGALARLAAFRPRPSP
jgi:hypothetical protein